MTHTVATLEISAIAFQEITDKLRAASYDHLFMADGSIDMYGIGLARTAVAPSGAAQAPMSPIQGHDLSTSAGGAGYLAEYFATRLRTHTYQRYIEDRLAKDFACALSKHLSERDANPVAPASAAQAPTMPVELLGVAAELKNGDGHWRTCSGCHESEDGHPVGHYPFSEILNCDLGSGCRECGGIGAVWDDTDYGAMGDALEAQEIAQERAEAAQVPTAWVRFRSDGGFEGPIMDSDSRMCDTRRTCGAWTPLYAAPVAPAAAAPNEDAYVAQRMSETLAEVWATIMGNDAQPEDKSMNAIERVKKAAQVLRLEVDLYRAQREEAAAALTADDADMVWPDDDGEMFFHTIDDAVEYEVDQAWPTTGPLELKLHLAKRIPNATVRIFNITENGREWEILPTTQGSAQ